MLKELREKLQAQAASIRQMADKINAESRDFSAEEQTAWDQVNKDYNETKAKLDQFAKRQEIERQATAAQDYARTLRDDLVGRVPSETRGEEAEAITDAMRTTAFNAWARSQYGCDLTEGEVRACRTLRFNPQARNLTMPLYGTEDYKRLQRRFLAGPMAESVTRCEDFSGPVYGAAMSSVLGSGGGNLVPAQTMLRTLEINMLAFGGIRQVAETIRTTSGERMAWPTFDDTSNTGAMLGENTSVGTASNPTVGKIFWDAYKFTSNGALLVPYELLLEDSAFDLASIIFAALGERLGRITSSKYTTGTGANEPKGIVTAASLGVTAASGTAIAADECFGLQHAVNPAYRNGASWLMHDNILLALRKLKDSQNRYLWEPSLQNGIPDRFLNSPVNISMEMASSMASGNKTLIYGQLNRYKIRTVNQVRVYRLQERYRDIDQDGFVAFIREDGNLVDAGTSPVKYLVHP